MVVERSNENIFFAWISSSSIILNRDVIEHIALLLIRRI